MNILLVEDDRWLGDMYASALDAVGAITVHRASDAAGALEVLDATDVDLLVLDIFLGEHTGVELLHEMMSYEDCNQIPVVVLSAVHEHNFGMSEERWQHYNVVKYLYKPQTTPAKLVATLQKLHTKVKR